MRTISARRTWIVALLLASTACTQEPAQIDLRGHQSYSRNGSAGVSPISFASNGVSPSSGNYASYSPSAGPGAAHSTVTQSSAAVQSIGVSDLGAPPGGSKTATAWGRPVAKPATPPAPAISSMPLKKTSAEPVTVAPSRAAEAVQSQALPSERVNPWTKKPRQEDASAPPSADQSLSISPKGKAAGGKEPLVSEMAPASEPKGGLSVESIVAGEDAPAPLIETKSRKPVASTGFMWPVGSKKITSNFGPKGKGRANDGIAIASAGGEPVWASADGEVVYVGNEIQGYGNMVLIKHAGNKSTTYAHLSRYTVDKYERVKQGDIIGYVGNSGNTKQSQLYFAIRDGKDAVDPMKYLNRNVASLR
jgi:murein DD-endopeptidase MepM/ murein hydrolase activator NlpD